MSVLFILIGISTLVAAIFLIAFLWSVSNGQYDDDYTPFENEPESKKPTLKEKKTTKKHAV